MSEDQPRARSNVHMLTFTAQLDIALVKLQAKLEIGEKYGSLYAITEGFFRLGYLSQEDHDLLIKRYSEKLVDVVKKKRALRENRNIPVLTLEKQKEKELLEQREKQFKGIMKDWDSHDSEWRRKALDLAEKWKEKVPSARALLDRAQKD